MCFAVSAIQHRGFILMVSLLVLLLLALLAATVMQTSLLQLRLAVQLENRVQARQAALGQLEAWLAYMGHSVPSGRAGDRHCVVGVPQPDCDHEDLPAELAVDGETELRVVAPAGALPPPRLAQSDANSAVSYRAAQYELTVTSAVDGTAVSLTQGVTVLHPGVTQ